MKKKIKLFSTIAVLCLCIATLTLGVFSALTLTYKTTGKITYNIEDAFVDIETRVYSSSKKFSSNGLLETTAQSYETSNFAALDELTETGIVEGETTYTFNKVQLHNLNKGEGYVVQDSDYQNIYSSVTDTEPPTDLELNIKYNIKDEEVEAVQTYFFVTRLKNQSILPLYAYVPTIGEDKYVAPENSFTYKLSGYKELSTKDSEVYIVFAMSLKDVTEAIDEKLFVLPIVVTMELSEADALFVEAQESVYKTTSPISTQTELKQYVNAIINGTQTLSQPAGLDPAPQSTAPETVSSKNHTYNSSSGYLVRGMFTKSSLEIQSQETYFIVLDIANGSTTTLYTKISSDTTTTVTGMQTYISDTYLRLLAGENQKIVLAYNVTDTTQLPSELQIKFDVELSETPYTYADIEDTSGFLVQCEKADGSDYSNLIRSVTFTNNQADFDMAQVTESYKVGEATAEDGTKSDLKAYFIPNGELFDVYTYAPVSTIYTPEDCFGFFSEWFWMGDGLDADSYSIYWSYNSLEYVNLKTFDISKTLYLDGFFLGATNLKRVYGLENLETAHIQSCYAMFMGCSNLEEVNLSNFKFDGLSHELFAMGMVGANDEYIAEAFGENATPILEATTKEEKIYQVAYLISEVLQVLTGGGARYVAEQMFKTSIGKIICPKDIGEMLIGLPYGQWRNQDDASQTTSFLLGDNIVLIPA